VVADLRKKRHYVGDRFRCSSNTVGEMMSGA
jgi:hypothetical protein